MGGILYMKPQKKKTPEFKINCNKPSFMASELWFKTERVFNKTEKQTEEYIGIRVNLNYGGNILQPVFSN